MSNYGTTLCYKYELKYSCVIQKVYTVYVQLRILNLLLLPLLLSHLQLYARIN
jgi:hypothetical protein